MPTLKFERVVSCSNEDPNFPATNLLESEAFKKWKCKPLGEDQAVVILQLESPSYISGVDIGNEGSGFVEVLVGRQSSDEFKVLVPSTCLMSPRESTLGENKNRVQMFTKDKLCQDVVNEKWDRVKVVCRQPLNKFAQYGLCFLTLHSPEDPMPSKIVPKERKEEEDLYKPGYLFARRKELLQEEEPMKGAAAIRAASRPEALQQQGTPKNNKVLEELQQKKNSPAPVKRKSPSPQRGSSSDKPKPVDSPSVDNPKKTKLGLSPSVDKPKKPKLADSPSVDKPKKAKVDHSLSVDKPKKAKNVDSLSEDKLKKTEVADSARLNGDGNVTLTGNGTSDSGPSNSRHMRPRPSDSSVRNNTPLPKKMLLRRIQRQKKPFNKLLDGVVFVMSGYQNPERGNIRSMALEMGAKYKPNWDYTCTHLVCAFRNTPKYQQVRGKDKPIVTKEWIEQCYAQRVRLPWRRHALDKRDRDEPESEDEIKEAVKEPTPPPAQEINEAMEEKEPAAQEIDEAVEGKEPTELEDDNDREEGSGSGCDTDEEIQKVKQQSQYNPAFDSDTEIDEPTSPHPIPPELPLLPTCPVGGFKEGSKVYLAAELDPEKKSDVMATIIYHHGDPVEAYSEHCDYIVSDRPAEEHEEDLKRWPGAKVIPLYGPKFRENDKEK